MYDAAIYARLSRKRKTDDNPDGLSENIPVQIAESQAYADDASWSVVATFKDDDKSASKYSKKPRPDYERLVVAVRANQIEVVVSTEITRLYRRLEELLELIKLAEITRLKRIETTDGMVYRLDTPEGIHQAIAAVNGAMLESARTSKRVKRKKKIHAQAGLPSGGPRPFGFEADKITPRESERALLVEAKDRYLAGETMRDIVRDFFDRGVVSPLGKPWMIENFQRVVFSERYIGVRVHQPEGQGPETAERYPAQWPKFWEPEERDMMLARQKERAMKYPGRPRGGGRKYLLTGFLTCGLCGAVMVGSRRKLDNGRMQRRYRCRYHDNYGQRLGCGKVFRDADALDLFVKEAVLVRFNSPEVETVLTDAGEDTTSQLIADHQAAKLRLDTMVADYVNEFLTKDEFAVAKRVAEANLQTARDALAKAQERKVKGLVSSLSQVREAFETGGIDLQHSIIGLIVERVVCKPGHPGSHRWRGFRFQPNDIAIRWKA